jgi:hypothetical protein
MCARRNPTRRNPRVALIPGYHALQHGGKELTRDDAREMLASI